MGGAIVGGQFVPVRHGQHDNLRRARCPVCPRDHSGGVAGQVCIDELEMYGPQDDTNLALAESGVIASASSCLPGYAIHQVAHLNDGLYGKRS